MSAKQVVRSGHIGPSMTAELGCVCGGSKSQPNRDCERCQLIAQRDSLLVQKDALLAACEAAEKAIGGECDIEDCENCKAYRLIVAAIALTKETRE